MVGEVLYEEMSGPNSEGKRQFAVSWRREGEDDQEALRLNGRRCQHRAQHFLSDMRQMIDRHRGEGKKVFLLRANAEFSDVETWVPREPECRYARRCDTP
jgi:hypothetical protein